LYEIIRNHKNMKEERVVTGPIPLSAEPSPVLDIAEPSGEARRWLYVLSRGIVFVYIGLFLLLLDKVGPEDQDQFLVFHELQFWNNAFFGMAKQWTPLMCGGLSLAGEPQVPFMSLSMALAYVVGPFWALKLATVLYFLEGWLGAYLYAGMWLRQREPRLLAAALFIGNGFFVCRYGYGHIDFIPFLILPLLLWILHQAGDAPVHNRSGRWRGPRVALLLLMGGLVALAIDGSPVAIIHLMLWVGLYAAALGWVRRSVWPPLYCAGAFVLAAILDAGYLWPMLQAQSLFPRLTPDQFTSFLSLLWFAIIPMRGKVLPANGLGHELSVYIGPVLAWLLWRERGWLRQNVPRKLLVPLLFVSCVSIVLGMGSLRSLHVPALLSPFDLLRPLPGFRSLGVTGRFWGFLPLPLSLWGAAVLWKWAAAHSALTWRWRIACSVLITLQLGFQLETVLAHWLPSRDYRATPLDRPYVRGPQTISYVLRGKHPQGEVITPTQAALDCYDMDDFQHADIRPGRQLIQQARTDRSGVIPASSFSGQFAGWNHLAIRLSAPDAIAEIPASVGRIRLQLNQAYHPYWHAPQCTTEATPSGNLLLSCPPQSFEEPVVRLTFDDTLSDEAAAVSRFSWQTWLWAVGSWLLANAAVAFRRPEPWSLPPARAE
jgi:hypothetical protein